MRKKPHQPDVTTMDLSVKKVAQLEKAFLRASTTPRSFDEEAMTMDVVFTTGARGLRSSFFSGNYYEELSMERSQVRLQRLNAGAPVLLNHDSSDVNNVIGVVENARVVDGEGVATIRFTKSNDFQEVIGRIKEGIIRKLSVGYMVYRYEELDEEVEGLPVFRAIDWEPVEISFVAVPFDNSAEVRSAEEKSVCEIIRKSGRGEKEMSKKKKENAEIVEETREIESDTVESVEKPSDDAAIEVAAEEKEGIEISTPDAAQVERIRVRGILECARKANQPEESAWKLIDAGASLEEARSQILERWAKEGVTVKVDSRIDGVVDAEVGTNLKRDAMAKGIVNALMHRANPGIVKLEDEGKQYRGLSILEMAREALTEAGFSTRGLEKQRVASAALNRSVWERAGFHGTTDFPSLLADVANKTLRKAYDETPQSWRQFVRVVSAADFKNINRVQLGEAPTLELVGEHGEITHGTMGDAKETYNVKTYGRIFAITRQALVNDDLDAFTRAPMLLGRSAANLESDLVYAVFTGNPTMGDGNQLFVSGHGNLGTAGAISDTTLTEMRKKGRLQTGLDNETLLNITHKFLIVPAALETVAQKQLASIVPDQSGSVNPFSGAYTLIVEPRLDAASATNWFASADPGQIDTIEIAYLDGSSGVRIESEIDFDVEGMKIKAVHDVGVKAIDWRGVFKNPS